MADTHGKSDSGPPSSQGAGGTSQRSRSLGAPRGDLPPDWSTLAPLQPIPDRYEARESEDGLHVVCDEAPRMRVSIHVANSFSESEAREFGERVILLDGAGRFGPLIDNKNRLYNLDHHEGCERTFTLATCEQALLLVHSGLDLGEGDWTVFANEPDLDTILALWCLLNYQRVPSLRPEARDVLLPLIRLEGAIDSNGTELASVCGLPRRALADAQEHVDELLVAEVALRQSGEWLKTDLHEYVVDRLAAVDQIVYEASDFLEYRRIDEVFGHVELGGGRVAVACRDEDGIYEVEQRLKARWGDQLALIALEKERGHYTLRRTSTLSDIDLERAYETLNTLADERHIQFPPGRVRRDIEEVIDWAKAQGLAADPVVQRQLVDLAVEVLEVEMHGLLVLDAMQRGPAAAAEAATRAAANKVVHTVVCQKIARAALDFGGSEALVEGARPELLWRQSMWETIGGGTSEVMRSVVAKQALGLSGRR